MTDRLLRDEFFKHDDYIAPTAGPNEEWNINTMKNVSSSQQVYVDDYTNNYTTRGKTILNNNCAARSRGVVRKHVSKTSGK